MIVRVWERTVSSSVFEPPERTTSERPADSTIWRTAPKLSVFSSVTSFM